MEGSSQGRDLGEAGPLRCLRSVKRFSYCSLVFRFSNFLTILKYFAELFKSLWFVFLNVIFETVVETELLGSSENWNPLSSVSILWPKII